MDLDQVPFYQYVAVLCLLFVCLCLARLFLSLCERLSKGPAFRPKPDSASTDPKDH